MSIIGNLRVFQEFDKENVYLSILIWIKCVSLLFGESGPKFQGKF